MGGIIRFCNDLVGNQYFFALLIFAVIVEILLLPFGIMQQRNSRKQAKLRPKEMAIRKKYAGREDNATKQKMSQEIQEMYSKEGYSPMAGCLQIFIQFPIIIALYNIVMNPLKYICGFSEKAINGVMGVVKGYSEFADVKFDAARNINLMDAMRRVIEKDGTAPFANVEGFSDVISSAADVPNLTIFGGAVNLADIPAFTNFNWLMLVPVLTFVVYFLSMKVNRKLTYQPVQDASMGCSNKIMDYAMPLMSVAITFSVPAALGVYWIFKCIIGMLKQFLIKICMPIPTYTEEELKAAESEYGSSKPQRSTAPSDKKVRSLHHIDDDDYEDVTPQQKPKKQSEEAAEEETHEALGPDKKEEKADNGIIGQAQMKEDNPHSAMESYREKFRKKKKDKEDKK